MIKALSKSKMLAIVLVVVVAIRSGHALQTIFAQTFYLVYIPSILAALVFIAKSRSMKLKNQYALLFGSVFFIVCTMFVSNEWGMFGYIEIIMSILAAYAISEIYPFEKVANLYIKIMLVTTVIAIIGHFLANNTEVLGALPQYKNVNGVRYRLGYIFNFLRDTPERNCGMFWEPGIFATHLSFALIFELITNEKRNFLRIAIFVIGILTSNSSAGFAMLFFVAVFFFVQTQKRMTLTKAWGSLILFAAAFLVVINLDAVISGTSLAENEYVQKLVSENIMSSTRIKALQHNWEIFMQSPFFGVGYGFVSENMKYVADTSTTTYLMSVFGLGGILYTIVLISGIFRMRRLNIYSKMVLAVIALIIINKEPHQHLLFSWMLLFYLSRDKDSVENVVSCNSEKLQEGEDNELKELS